ncbi:LegC family aminotransferase [Hoeflea sp. WL0058]|uniref:GDP-perosamine synthase n=1 Tax=Flavimaribacter sediminis TaxID=2865987 RepID=A0AAE2ZKH6_9HYPH|nr:LegC family aminotransferase [Flavimaribacter sediminis]MBW8636210.1 LegC family aminotransferase [Flavimaribacter sediminis]
MTQAQESKTFLGDATFRAAVLARLREVLDEPDDFVPLHAPEFSGAEWKMVKDCLDSGWVSSVGSYVDRFERDVAKICGVAHGVALVNGTAALHLALRVVGVMPGDEVIVPAMTFVATANAISHAGAIPHFVDSEARTLGLDPQALDRHLDQVAKMRKGELINHKTGARIAAILPMHIFGHPTDMYPLLDLAAAYDLPVVEDAAEALGSHYHGRACGGLGRIAALSFNGNKILTTGGGGAIVTDDPDLAWHAKHLSTTGKLPHRWAFYHDEIAYNYRLPNINAALGCAQLEQLKDRLARKRALAERYIAGFADLDGVTIFREPEGCQSNYWLNTLILDPDRAGERNALLDELNEAGFMCRPVWSLLHRLPFYSDCPRTSLPVVEDLERRIISLPSSACLGAI